MTASATRPWYTFRFIPGHLLDPPQHVDLPGMMICHRRKSGEKTAVLIPLNKAHEYCKYADVVDGEAVMDAARAYADVLYGRNAYTESEARAIGDLVLHGLGELIQHYPAPIPTRAQVEQQMADAGLKILRNGQTVADFTA